MFDIESIKKALASPDVRYYMATAGQGLMGPEHPMQSVAAATKQQIAAQEKRKLSMEYIKMFKGLLAGEGSKFSTDGKTFKFDGPSALLGDDVSELLKGGEDSLAGTLPGTDTGQSRLEQDFLNPSASPLDISSASLVGLTPADVTQALQTGLGYGSLEQKRISDFAKMMAPTPTDPRDEPFISNYTLRQFNALTPDYKEYTLAKEGAKTLGDKNFMSYRNWRDLESSERIEFLEGLKGKPELLKIEKKLAEARRTTPEPTKLSLMNISTASREIDKRFGSLDATGTWTVTPELQSTRTKAHEFLADFHKAGMDLHPAVNKAEIEARKWKDTIEDSYHARIAAAQQDERMINHINSEFYRQFKYIPSNKRTR